MSNAMNLIKDLPIILNIDRDELEPLIIKGYLAIRLEPLLGIPGATETKLNAIANIFSNLYFKKGYTLDFLINAVYNYINKTNKCPPNHILNDDINAFLKEYAQQ